MDNPYTSQYMPNGMPQNQQGLSPVFQNAGAQQQYMNQQLAQSNQLAQPQTQKSGYSGMNPMDLAKMLRKDPNAPQGNSFMDRASAYLGTQNTPEMQAQVNQLGSNTWNPMSNYNMGTNGWGSFGE
jgi:hypothetical protein